MTITTHSLRGEDPKKKPQKVSPERRKAIALLNSIDSGMTLTRFQIESARKFDAEVDEHYDFDHCIQAALFALSTIDPSDTEGDKASYIGVALQSIVLAVDLLDRDIEDVATEALNNDI